MKGETVKEILKRNNITLNDVAKAMGETPQNLQSLLRAEDIKSGVLERIATAINKSVYFFYEDSRVTVTGSHNTTIQGDGNCYNSESERFHALLQKKDEQIDRLIALLELKSK